ncbi:LysR family transcriptional regulator [Moraxella sp. ZY210820]|uniref:LysR family transcriptional regulator n=1 Tax=unclassified Moraxella TaxID=2685852 RepID=UPI002731E071|nr:LysR family transcriptional regulator [Moraxella sp. ZY210820]WLF83346.1 LysR family transcriptional regulator [Moraxella sp. ZY210820]
MNLNALSLFVAVIKHGSLSKTAEKLGVPIATISRQIAELEKSLQIQLFDRQKSGVKPTMAGQKLYDEVHLSIDNLLNAKQVLFDDEQNLKGILRISAPPKCEPVLAWVSEFQQKFPNVQIHATMTERILDLSADSIDVAFRIGELHGEHFIAKKVATLGTKWVAHPELLARFGTPSTLKELKNFPIATWAKNGENEIIIQMNKEKIALPFLFASNDAYAVEYMVLQGQAIGQISDLTANEWIKDKRVVEILPELAKPNYDLFMLYASKRYPSAIVRKFVEFVLGKIQAA